MLFRLRPFFAALILAATLLGACAPQPQAVAVSSPALTQTFDAALTLAVQSIPTETGTPTLTATPEPTHTPSPTPTVPRTPSPLPPVFTSTILDKEVKPQTYVEDTCQYLK